MIINKKKLPRHCYKHFVDWELFWLEFPEEAGIIGKEFIRICRSSIVDMVFSSWEYKNNGQNKIYTKVED